MAAEVLSKTIFASWWWNGHKQHHGIFSSSKMFPSLKLKPQVLRSSFGKGRGKSLFRAQTGQTWWERQRDPPKWWEVEVPKPNMRDVSSVEDLVDSLLNAGEKLVIVGFYSPACLGCKYLHPKICELAEMNPDVEFLWVNCENHQSLCYSLKVFVHPFFHFYRGADGHLCKFSCTLATINKFKDLLDKHKQDRCSSGPTKGLDEQELQALSQIEDDSFIYRPKAGDDAFF
ncbi:Thioredoxin-like superfamily [Sesbania bispinosa]|nr:Thioredoxin-like superfamily [Sesbania bispinosa]